MTRVVILYVCYCNNVIHPLSTEHGKIMAKTINAQISILFPSACFCLSKLLAADLRSREGLASAFTLTHLTLLQKNVFELSHILFFQLLCPFTQRHAHKRKRWHEEEK